MRIQAILLGSVLVLAAAAQQGAAGPAVNLKVSSRVPLPYDGHAVPLGSIKCDGEGNIYSRLLTSEPSRERGRIAISEVAADGVLVAAFRVTKASQSDVSGKRIFVSRSGSAYQIARLAGGIHVVGFAKDGNVSSIVELEVDARSVEPWDLAVFNDGGYLLTGETGPDLRTPYTAVFGKDGRLVKRIYEPEDEDAKRRAESGDVKGYVSASRGNPFVGLGSVTTGSDDNVYVLRGTSPTLIYVVSAKGEIVRKLRPHAAPDFGPRNIESYADRLAIGYDGPYQTLVKVIDLEGNETADYHISYGREQSLDFACYSSQGLAFIEASPGERSFLVHALLP